MSTSDLDFVDEEIFKLSSSEFAYLEEEVSILEKEHYETEVERVLRGYLQL